MMPEYDLRTGLESIGKYYSVDDDPLKNSNWTVTELTADRIVFTRLQGMLGDFKVIVKQRRPQGADLPFVATREVPMGDRYRLAESDFIATSINAAEAYMLGFDEGHDAEL